MVKKFVVAFALVALMAAPAFASVQNVKVSGDLKTTSFIRNGFDLGIGNGTTTENNREQNVVLSQVGLNVDADLTDNVSTKIGVGSERLWGTTIAPSNDTLTVDTAYVTMKELLYSPLTLTVGRQELAYGNKLIIGKSGTNRVTEVRQVTGDINFDAVKAVLSYDPLTVDLFAAKVSEVKLTSDGANSNVNLFGINANYKLGDKMSTVVEAYTFVKTTGNAADANGSDLNAKGDALYVPGLRVSTNPIEGLNVQLEGAYQTGTKGYNATTDSKENVSAYVLQGMAKYALPVMKDMTPVVSANYTLFSGETEPVAADAKTQAYQSMYNRQFGDVIWYNLFSQSNISVINLAVEVKPIQDLTAKLSWTNLNQAQSTRTIIINRPDYLTTTSPSNAKGQSKELGNEVDLNLTYAYTEDVKFGMNAGYFAPGKGLSPFAQDSATQLVSSVSVAF